MLGDVYRDGKWTWRAREGVRLSWGCKGNKTEGEGDLGEMLGWLRCWGDVY